MNDGQKVEDSRKDRIPIVIESKNHKATIDEIGEIQGMHIERNGGKAPYPTTVCIDAIQYLHTGMSRRVVFVTPLILNDSPEVEISKALSYYREGCSRGVNFSE